MMTQDTDLYSTIRGDGGRPAPAQHGMNKFYDLITEPVALLLLFGAQVTWFNQDLFPRFMKARQGDIAEQIHVGLTVLSLAIAVRLLHSVHLAKRDYSHLKAGFKDVFMFLALMAVTSGGLIAAVYHLNGTATVVLVAFVPLAVLGTYNFLDLYLHRIPEAAATTDYEIERRIQGINAIVFGAMVVLIALAAWLSAQPTPRIPLFAATIGAIVLLLIFNIAHSSQLTMHPKFLIHNRPDSSPKLLETLHGHYGAALGRSDDEILDFFRPLAFAQRQFHTVRATKDDIDLVGETLLDSFSYMFEWLFQSKDPQALMRGLRVLLRAGNGFGDLGYRNFYFIRDEDEVPVGLFKIDVRRRITLYRTLQYVSVAAFVAFKTESRDLFGFIRRATIAGNSQGVLKPNDMRLTYLVIFPEFRRLGYAASFLRLLELAHLVNNTNHFSASRIVLGVRSANKAAQNAFAKAGYVPVRTRQKRGSPDPFAGTQYPGDLLQMERTVEATKRRIEQPNESRPEQVGVRRKRSGKKK